MENVKRAYTRRTPTERHDRLIERLARLKLAHAKRDSLIGKLEQKLKPRLTS